MRTYVYVDGFNFYYAYVKDTPYKWIDYKKLCERLLKPEHEIHKIKYFTAKVRAITDPDQPARQAKYFEALENYLPEIHIIKGHFTKRDKYMPLASDPTEKVKVIKTEEKVLM